MVLAGCGSTHVTIGDAPPAVDPDAGPDANNGQRWRLETRPATSLAVLGDSAIDEARPVRVTVGTELDPCEEIAEPLVEATADHVTITPRVWVPVGPPCTSTTSRSLSRPMVLAMGGLTRVTALIAATGTTDTISLQIPTAPPDCIPGRMPCQADCDCPDSGNGQRCLTTADAQTMCAIPCEVDRDCRGGTCVPSGNGLPWACVASPPERSVDKPCATGWACYSGECQPTFFLETSTRGPCASDADCVPGLRCIEADDPLTHPSCQAVCETDGPWCQGPHQCFERNMDVSALAGTGAVCGWIGE